LEKIDKTLISAIGYDPQEKLLVLGDVFGNVEIWDCKSLIKKIEKNSNLVKEKFGKKRHQGNYDNANNL
jgi:hypothetical protein